MGARFGTECFADAISAASAQCAATHGVTSSGLLRCNGVAGTAETPLLNLELVGPGYETPVLASVAFAGESCDPFGPYADMVEMFGFAIVALVTVWVVKQFVYKLVMPQ